jgi:amidase
MELTAPQGEFRPHPSVFKRFKALVYPTRPKQPDLIDPNMPNIVDRMNAPSFTSIANGAAEHACVVGGALRVLIASTAA